MLRRIKFLTATLLFAFAAFLVHTPAARADITCTGTVGGASSVTTINGNVVVPNGASCTLSFVNVTGNVTAGLGSTLLINAYLEPSTIGGNVTATGCASALLEGVVTVAGNVSISSCTGGPNGFQGPDALIQGSFSCQSNVVAVPGSMPCLAWLGKVVGNVTISANISVTAPDVSLVTTSGTLDCETNSPAPTQLHGPSWVDGSSMGQCSGFATTSTSISTGAVTPAASCAALASLPASGYPVPNVVITSAVDTAASGTLPRRCIVNGYVNRHQSPVDNCFYQEGFQVQLPFAGWNGRFFMEGGSGGEGSVPTATGTNSGSAGSNFGITNGWAVASQDGGHENTDLSAATCDSGYANAYEYNIDPMGNLTQAGQSIEVTALVAKYLINQYYGTGPKYSYWVGCSTGGRQGMAMSEIFPSFFDGIVAGDPVYNLEGIQIEGLYNMINLQNVYAATPGLPAESYVAGPAPTIAEPLPYAAFPTSDQALAETALLQACDAMDGVMDGVVDNQPACQTRFNPANASWTDYAGAVGPAGATYPLQCTGAKNATCLSAAQIQWIQKVHQGARTSTGLSIQSPAGAAAPNHVDNTVQGYAYDGGSYTTVGVPSRSIGSPTSPGSYWVGGVVQFPYAFISPPNPTFNMLAFNFDTGPQALNATTPLVANNTSLDISHFINYGHKIIWYHGASDPGPPFLETLIYYQQMAERFGGIDAVQKFSRFYPVPNMDHCTGGATTDQFDMTTPLVNWVEQGIAPAAIPATGVNFNAATYQTVGNYITGTFINAPTTRNRLLCPYPQQSRFIGKTTLVNGIPVASNPQDLANSANYTCINVTQVATHDFNGDGKSDVLWRDTSNNIGMWLMNGSAISQSGVIGNATTFWSVVGQRDFTGSGLPNSTTSNNGNADVLWRDNAGNVGMWLMNGNQIVSSTVLGNVPTNWSVVGTGDLNGDSYGDILWRDTAGDLGVWFMNGTSIMQTAIIGNVPLAWSVAGVDSKGDIFWYNTTTGEVGMWVMNGANVIQEVDFGPVPSNWKIAGIGDFDGNGSTDILWRDTSGNVGIWLMSGTSILSTTVIGNVPLNWSIAQTGDYNGDGKADVLWVDNLGNVAAWFMNGATVSSVSNYGNVGTAWNVQSNNAE
jgi:Tannase and feruloyl esterase/FG-GAP-like repeat